MGWAERFIEHCKSPDLASFGEGEIKAFLTDLAVERDVTAGTQNQAKCALLFLYQNVLGRDLGFLDVGRATKPSRLPVVLSRPEIGLLLPEFRGLRLLMFLVIWRLLQAGNRSRRDHQECRAAFAEAQFCHAFTRGWCGYPHRAGVARAQGRADDHDLSARDEQAGSGGEEPGRCLGLASFDKAVSGTALAAGEEWPVFPEKPAAQRLGAHHVRVQS